MNNRIRVLPDTDRKQNVFDLQHAEAHYERLLLLYAFLTQCNQAIVRCTNRQELFDAICEIAVNHGGMQMAWVGIIDDSGVHIKDVARYGVGTEILDKVYISVNSNDPRGRGPSGTAIRENQPTWCQEFSSDPRLEPWREIIVPYGWRATATIPLCSDGKPVAAFSMYSHQTDAFDQNAKDLLLRVGLDISHALDIYEHEEERKRHEALLHGESLETLSQRDAALREISQGVYITNSDRVITYVNDAFTRNTGYVAEDVLGKRCSILHGPKTCRETVELARKRLKAELNFQGEILNYRRDGTPFWNDVSITPVHDERGTLVQWIGVQQDITQRKLHEARILRLKNLFATLSHCNHAIVHSKNEQELFDTICHGAVKHGGFILAWIGIFNEQENRLIPTANHGRDNSLLDKLVQHANTNNVWSESPSSEAAKNGQPTWCQDFLNDPKTNTWHEIAKQHDMLAIAALPLYRNGKIFGNFTLYADVPHAFDKEVRDLLLEMAQDVSFALDNFERERERIKAEEQLRIAANIFEQSKEAITIVDSQRNFIMVNKAFTEITGYTEEEILGKNIGFRHRVKDPDTFNKAVAAAVTTKGEWQGEYWNRRKNGEEYLEQLSIKRVFDDNGNLLYSTGIFSDITKSREKDDHVQWLLNFDTLTRLPNRTLLEDRCRQAINIASTDSEPIALMFLDLDHFKNINDSLGHRIGDLLLAEITKRLKSFSREQDTLSRLGGDDFVLMLPDTDFESAAHTAEEIIAAIEKPFMIEGNDVNISCSIGVAMYPEAGKNFDALIQCADMAMFKAKEMGRGKFHFYTSEIQERLVRKLQLEKSIAPCFGAR